MIYVRLTLDGSQTQFSTKQMVRVQLWDVRNYRVTGYTPEAESVNNYLDYIKRSIINHYQELMKYSDVVTPEIVRDAYMGLEQKQTTLLTYFTAFIKKHEKLVGIDLGRSWFQKYKLTYRRVEEFLIQKRRRQDISLHAVDNDFIIDFHVFLKVDCGMSVNSSEKLMRILKRVTTLAFKERLIRRDPFASYKLKKAKTDRGFLTEEELTKLIEYRPESERLQKVRNVFVFACFTGMDYSTMASFTSEHIINKESGKFIKIPRTKTGFESEIKLLPQACEILSLYEDQKHGKRILPLISNVKYNLYLKEIGEALGIKKNLTSHTARHTFATTVTLAHGVSLVAIQKMLGHAKIATTQIYARMLDTTVEREMIELERKLGMKFSTK